MVCSIQVRLAFAALIFAAAASGSFVTPGQTRTVDSAAAQTSGQGTEVTLRWGARAGVSRYRLQLAQDAAFTDIVFDRVVRGHEYTISELSAGRYFWRVASLGTGRDQFSSAGVVEVRLAPVGRQNATSGTASTAAGSNNVSTKAISTAGGWFAAIGNVAQSIVAHLRTRGTSDLIVTTDDGRVVALEAATGRALWTARPQALRSATSAPALPLAVPARNGLDNVLLLSSTATLIEGATGRTLWQMRLANVAARATAVGEKAFVLDNSLQRLFVLSAGDGRAISDVRLPQPVIGAPTSFLLNNTRGVIVALDDGRLQFLDESGKLIRDGNAGSPATTAPLLVRTARGELLLVGTNNGLTALNAGDLRPLGRVTLKDGAPRGALTAQDLDHDGVAEVVMFTNRGRVVVVKSDEGKVVWEADAKQADSVAFADVDRDGVLDLLMAGREEFAFALSGRDGAMLWKSESPAGIATNHATARLSRSPFVLQTPAGPLLIAGDAFGGGLRALEFHNRSTPR